MPPRLIGDLAFTELKLAGNLRLGKECRLSLSDITGSAVFKGTLQAGPLRIPINAPLRLERAGGDLLLKPGHAGLLWLLMPFLKPTGQGWSWRGGALRLDPAALTGQRLTLAGEQPAGSPPGEKSAREPRPI